MSDSMPKPMTPKPPIPAPPGGLGTFIAKYGWVAVLLVMVAQHFGWITPDQAEQYRKQLPDFPTQQQGEVVPSPVPDPAPLPTPDPSHLTPEQIAELIRKAVEEALKKEAVPVPTPAAEDVVPAPIPAPIPQPEPTPLPVEPMRILVCDETGVEIVSSEVEAGQLFRVSAVGVGESIGWHPVKSGDVKLSASTDGKEFCGYLAAGQWVEFSLTDFASKTQASLRVTCLTAPQPPPDPDPRPDPRPEPTVKNVRLYVVHNVNKITPDTAIVLNATKVWDSFTDAGNDWKFFDIDTDDEYEKKLITDAGSITLPTLLIYDKATGRRLSAEPLPKSVIALEALVEKYTGAGR